MTCTEMVLDSYNIIIYVFQSYKTVLSINLFKFTPFCYYAHMNSQIHILICALMRN